MKCHQCAQLAMFLVGSDKHKVPLCLECNLKFVQLTSAQNEMCERKINYLTDQMEITVGLPGILPRFPERRPPQTIQTGDVTLNNIKVDRSVIGVLNTGNIESVDSAVTAMLQSGDQELASAVLHLSQAVLSSTGVASETKNKILELLSILATEGTAPKERRRLSAMRTILQELAAVVGTISELKELWQQIKPIFEAAFSVIGGG